MLTQNYALKTLELVTMTTISMDNTFVFLWSLQWIEEEKDNDGYDDDKDDFDEDGDFHQYAPGAPMGEARIDGNALVTTKMARVDNDAIIPDKTCDAIKYL